MTPAQALGRLRDGNARVGANATQPRDWSAKVAAKASGPFPFAAVAKLSAKLIVVLGHTRCGAVKGAIEGVELGNLTGLLAKIHPAVEAAKCSDAESDACVTSVAEQNVRRSMRETRARSPYLAKLLDAGKSQLVGAMYEVETGRVTFLNP